MALVKDTLVSATTGDLKTNQLQIVMTERTTASFVTDGSNTVLPAGYPLAYAAGQYKPFVAADTDVAAFVWPEPITLNDTNNATGVIMLKGEIRKFSEVNDLLDVADQAAFLASCKDGLLAKGIVVRGVPNINQ